MSSYRALILDFGSVVSVSPFEINRKVERRLGLPEASLGWRGALDPANDPLWREMEADRISERDYWDARAAETGALLGQCWKPLDFFRAIRGADLNEDVRPEVVSLVRDARHAGLKIGLLSNELELYYGPEAIARLDMMHLVDHVVDATLTGILKPDPRSYMASLNGLGLSAGQALFVDDQHRNVAGALKVGIPSVHFDIRNPACSLMTVRVALGLDHLTAANGSQP